MVVGPAPVSTTPKCSGLSTPQVPGPFIEDSLRTVKMKYQDEVTSLDEPPLVTHLAAITSAMSSATMTLSVLAFPLYYATMFAALLARTPSR